VADEGGTRSEEPCLTMTILAIAPTQRLGTADDSCLPVVVPSRLVFYLEERSAFSVEHSYMISIKESGPSPLILLSVMGTLVVGES